MNSDQKTENLSEQELKDAFIHVISDKMGKADWYYEYSDDHNTWAKGSREMRNIREDVELLSRLKGGLDEAKKLWDWNAPPDSIPPPNFLHDPLLLHKELGGLVMRQDLDKIWEILLELQSKGNRFVAFDSDPLILPKGRFTGFTSAIAAENFAYEHLTLETLYVAVPIACMLKEMDEVLAPNKERLLQEVAERLLEYQQQDKRSRGPELSR